MPDKFTVIIASDEIHDKVFAEIYSSEKFVALVSQDDGLDNMKIEFPDRVVDEAAIMRIVELEPFREALIIAQKRLSGELT